YTQAIIGIGMNVNMPEAAKDEIKQPWTSLQNITDYAHDRNKIVAEMIQQLQNYIKQFTVNGLNYFLEEWRQYDALLQKRIHLEHGHQTIAGVVCGINSQGNLVLHQDDGTIAAYSSGDTSIRK